MRGTSWRLRHHNSTGDPNADGIPAIFKTLRDTGTPATFSLTSD